MYENNEEKKEEYWFHFCQYVAGKKKAMRQLTPRRLGIAKKSLWFEPEFWDDILGRHGGCESDPMQMKNLRIENYTHMIGNMTGMVMGELVRIKEIKP